MSPGYTKSKQDMPASWQRIHKHYLRRHRNRIEWRRSEFASLTASQVACFHAVVHPSADEKCYLLSDQQLARSSGKKQKV
jgi:hypothetical protein